jgi:D-tyrosyl-tRNA(Tyr) deacylase
LAEVVAAVSRHILHAGRHFHSVPGKVVITREAVIFGRPKEVRRAVVVGVVLPSTIEASLHLLTEHRLLR